MFGIDVYLHWSLLVLIGFFVLQHWSDGPATMLFTGLFIPGIFLCVTLHEFGHALMARYYGIRTRDITLYPIGGVARLERISEKPGEEIAIALAGPAVNVVIIIGISFVLGALGVLGTLIESNIEAIMTPRAVDASFIPRLLFGLLLANTILVVFNMLPVFPMDGGRVFRALLSLGMGHLRATEVAAFIGMVAAGLFVVGGLFQGMPMLALIGFFVFLAGQQEVAVVRMKAQEQAAEAYGARLTGRHFDAEPLEVIPVVEPVLDPAALPAEPNFSGFTWDRRAGAWIEWRNGRPVHVCWVSLD